MIFEVLGHVFIDQEGNTGAREDTDDTGRQAFIKSNIPFSGFDFLDTIHHSAILVLGFLILKDRNRHLRHPLGYYPGSYL